MSEPARQSAPARHVDATFRAAIVFAIAALLAVLPLLQKGCSCGHDFDFHLLNWLEAAFQWRHGIMKPVWAFTPAYNAGEPRLLMYPPLSWATGAVLTVLLPWKFVPIAYTWLVLVLCGLAMHRLLVRWTSPGMATLGGCLYLVNPYMLFVAYERTAYAELLAAAWMPLLLAAMLRPRASWWRIALAVSLLWLTNAPAAVVGCYSVLLLGLARLLLLRKDGWTALLHYAGTVTGGVVAGLLLDSFYLLPMAMQRRYVQLELAVVPIARPDANFLFHYDPDAFHTHVLLQASWIAVGTCGAALLCGAVLWLRRDGSAVHRLRSMRARDLQADIEANVVHALRVAVPVLVCYTVVVFFLLTRWSVAVWHVAPELVFLQFPWRFLAMQSAVAVALLALMLQRFTGSLRLPALASAGVLTALLAGYFAGGRYFREDCGDDETVQVQKEQFDRRDGVGMTDEYTPTQADNDVLPTHLPPAYIALTAAQQPEKGPALLSRDGEFSEDMRFVTPALQRPALLIVRLRAFPGWHTLLDGVETQPEVGDDGLIHVPLAAGRSHTVEEHYRITRDQWAGMGLSGLTVTALAAGLAAWRRRRSVIMKRLA